MKSMLFLICTLFSALSASGQINILFPALYFDDEIDIDYQNKNWIGLYEMNKSTFLLKETEVNIAKAHHPMVDEENEMSGYQVYSNPVNPVLIFSNPENFKIGEVRFSENYESVIYPGDTSLISMDEKSYKLTATGDTEILPSGEKIVSNYSLYISNHEGISQLIGSSNFFDDKMFEIFWAGDLNGDNLLDLVIDLSYKYSFTEIVLFLSKSNQGDMVFYEKGRHRKYHD